MFKDIKQIIDLLQKKKIGPINIFDPKIILEEGNKHIYNDIINKKVTNDIEASSYLGFKNKEEKGYLMAMGRFRDQLINLIFFLDATSYPNVFTKNKVKATKHLFFGKIFLLAGAQQLAQKSFQKAIRIGLKNDYITIVESAMLDYIRIGVRTGSGSYLTKHIKDYPQILQWGEDLKIAEYQLALIFHQLNSRSSLSKEQSKSLKKSVEIINDIQNPFNDIRLREIHFLANAYFMQSISNFTELLKQCESYLTFITNSKKARKKHIKEMLRFSLIGNLHLKKFEKSKKIFEENKSIFNKNSLGFINFSELFFLTCMHTKKYEKAGTELYSIYENSFFEYMPAITKERWFLYEAFFIFAIEQSPNKAVFKKHKEHYMLRLNSFLNEKPIYSKDKEGLNTQILISQFLHLLSSKQYDEIINCTNALKVYSYRYLRRQDNSDYLRTFYFIKMLILLPKHAFNKEETIKASQEYFNKLKDQTGNYTNLSKTLEIIPYEHLWSLILKIL